MCRVADVGGGDDGESAPSVQDGVAITYLPPVALFVCRVADVGGDDDGGSVLPYTGL